MASEYWKKWYKKNKKRFVSLVSKHVYARRAKFAELISKAKDCPCVICGVKYDSSAMDLYHRDKEEKQFRISEAGRLIYSIKKLLEEIAKCDVYCANCRRIVDTEEYIQKKKLNSSKSSRRNKLRELISEMKSVPCADCNETYPAYCMELDHLGGDYGKKVDSISRMISDGKGKERIIEEYNKTESVCLNCHRVRTKARRLGDLD